MGSFHRNTNPRDQQVVTLKETVETLRSDGIGRVGKRMSGFPPGMVILGGRKRMTGYARYFSGARPLQPWRALISASQVQSGHGWSGWVF
jgi:hypothetical protein